MLPSTSNTHAQEAGPGQRRAKEDGVFLSEALWFLPSSWRVDLNRKPTLCTPKSSLTHSWAGQDEGYWGMHLRHCRRYLHGAKPKPGVSLGLIALPDIDFLFKKNYIPFFVMVCVCARTHTHALTCTHACMPWPVNILKLALSFHMWPNSGWSNSRCQTLWQVSLSAESLGQELQMLLFQSPGTKAFSVFLRKGYVLPGTFM